MLKYRQKELEEYSNFWELGDVLDLLWRSLVEMDYKEELKLKFLK